MSYIPASQAFDTPAPAPAFASTPTLAQHIAVLPNVPDETRPDAQFTRARQVEFLLALADCGAVRRASAATGISYRTVYRERRANRAFARAWNAALLSARALHEDVLACRAIDGVEEVVWFRGEEVGRRVRYDSRLLLAHLARLDRLTEDAAVSAFADDLEGALERFAAGIDDPAPLCPDCGEGLPMAEGSGEAGAAAFSPGLCDKCDSPSAKAAAAEAARRAAEAPCRYCGGRCNDPDALLTMADCRFDEEARIDAMCDAHPDDAPWPADFTGYDTEAVEVMQMFAFEAGVENWWLVVPPGEGDDPDEWHYCDQATVDAYRAARR